MKTVSFERLISNEVFFEKIIHHFQMNKDNVQIHNHFVSLVRQLKDCLSNSVLNPSISTLEMFLKNNMPSLEKHSELIWDNWNINPKLKIVSDTKSSETKKETVDTKQTNLF